MAADISVAGLFAGCGGLDYGFKQAGFNIEWANELDVDACSSYEQLVGHKALEGDIWECLGTVPRVDMIIGGPPCQSFSLVGKRLENDPRGQLVFAFKKVIEEKKPKAFLMENVPGLTASSIDGVKLHHYLAKEYTKLGYHVTILKLDASEYFVPQKRKRVFIVGQLGGIIDFHPIPSSAFADILGFPEMRAPVSAKQALCDLPTPLSKGDYGQIAYLPNTDSAYTKLLKDTENNLVSLHSMPTMSKLDQEFVKHIPPGGNYMNIPDDISTKRIKNFKKTGGRTTTYGRLHPDRPAYTINTYFNRPNVGANYHYFENRLITVREALRLQSFPDHFTPQYSTQRSLHMQIGNAVPPLLGRAMAESIKMQFWR
jgi:DNA (cytosine-5)-methyltransferase 1